MLWAYSNGPNLHLDTLTVIKSIAFIHLAYIIGFGSWVKKAKKALILAVRISLEKKYTNFFFSN